LAAPAFSVLIPAYNGESTLAGALDSLIAQSRSDWEAIVVDDGSTDSTAAIAAAYAARDPRIRLFSKPNGGTSSARNVAARLASAPLLSLLDQDDYYLPEYFERMGRFIEEHPTFDIYSCNAYYLHEDGRLEPRHPLDSPVRSYTLEEMLKSSCIHPQAVFRRSVFDLVGGFDEDRRCWTEDYDFWLRAMVAGARHIYTPEILAVYRWASAQKSSQAVTCAESDAYILAKLVDSGALHGKALHIAKRHLRQKTSDCVVLTHPVRAELEARLARGDLTSARSLYLRSRTGWSTPVKYLAGLPVMLISPRLFSRLFQGHRPGEPPIGGL
jgi:glycosyltransferase involved in cell wall biosynthesis